MTSKKTILDAIQSQCQNCVGKHPKSCGGKDCHLYSARMGECVGLTKVSLLQLIRRHCLKCSGNSPEEVQWCTGYTVYHIHIYRSGTDPSPSKADIEK
jgi:hypothetical protein